MNGPDRTVEEIVRRAIADRLLPPGTPSDAVKALGVLEAILADVFFTDGIRSFRLEDYLEDPPTIHPDDLTWHVLLSDAAEVAEEMRPGPRQQYASALAKLRDDVLAILHDS